jgi:hypothetical protein
MMLVHVDQTRDHYGPWRVDHLVKIVRGRTSLRWTDGGYSRALDRYEAIRINAPLRVNRDNHAVLNQGSRHFDFLAFILRWSKHEFEYADIGRGHNSG